MTYLKIAMAAIERYLLEKPIRGMYDDQKTKRDNPPFGSMVDVLRSRGYIEKTHASLIVSRYRSLSEVLHGSHA